MAKSKTKKRRIEVHRLTISGLKRGSKYTQFLEAVFRDLSRKKERVVQIGTRSHQLASVTSRDEGLRIRIMSFSPGARPDIVNTVTLDVSPNPLKDDETGVEWTHIVGKEHTGGFRLYVECSRTGILPTQLESFLDELVQKAIGRKLSQEFRQAPNVPVSVSVESVPSKEFVERIKNADRIKKVTVRVIRPNPGWDDLENDLGDLSKRSDASRVDLTVTSRRNDTLDADDGIVAMLEEMERAASLGFASAEVVEGSTTTSFSTEKLVQQRQVLVNLEPNGQVDEVDIFNEIIQFANADT